MRDIVITFAKICAAVIVFGIAACLIIAAFNIALLTTLCMQQFRNFIAWLRTR